MQRYFSTFPGSGPGVGLLLLRIVVGGAASTLGALYLMHTIEPNALNWSAGALAVVGGSGLVAGFLTPAAGAAASLATLFIVATWPLSGAPVLIDRLAAVILIVNTIALTLLGPGAMSVDARLFGRREIIVKDDPST